MHAAARSLAVLLVALAALVAPTAARADAGPVAADGADVRAAVAVAGQHWGAVPCGGAVAISWAADADPLHNASASWANPVDLYAAPERNTACTVVLNPGATWDWPKLCSVVVHELGHLLGHQHAADPADLMAAIYAVPLPACAGATEPEGTLTAAAASAAQAAAVAVIVPAPTAAAASSDRFEQAVVAASSRRAPATRRATSRKAPVRRVRKARTRARAVRR